MEPLTVRVGARDGVDGTQSTDGESHHHGRDALGPRVPIRSVPGVQLIAARDELQVLEEKEPVWHRKGANTTSESVIIFRFL